MELDVYPFVDAHGAYGLYIAGARAEGEPAENMIDLFVGGLFARRDVGRRLIIRRRDHARRRFDSRKTGGIASARDG